ncbi:MAG: Ig-like domain-containing protein, partial [Bacteroidota bacterium]
ILFSRCANPVTPTGGPKDIAPPIVKQATPANNSIHFQGKGIRLEFNEFVNLKDPNSLISFSPPFLPNTEFKIRGKSILLEFNDSLKKNTTYTINFGDAISDLTENNIMKNYSYVFSTGAYIDSLSYKGVIIDAFNQTPQKDVIAMMYINNNDTIPFDSLPFKVKPYYLGKTNENGEFMIRNIKNAPLKLFVLHDLNNNFIFDSPDEKIGFIDSLVSATYRKQIVPDTIYQDSLTKPDSTLKRDSINRKDTLQNKQIQDLVAKVRLFQQNDSVQRFLKAYMPQEGQIILSFKYPLKNPNFTALNLSSTNWKIEEHSRKYDTVTFWMKNALQDSLYLEIRDRGKILDTAKIDLTKWKGKKTKKEDEKKKRLTFASSIPGGSLNQFKSKLLLSSSYPLDTCKLSSFLLIDGKDTIHPKAELVDSAHRLILVNFKWKEDKQYKLIIPDSALFGMYGHTNDSISMTFKTKMERDFGSLLLDVKIKTTGGQYVIQLLDEKETLVEERIITASEKVKFTYMTPRKYKIKAILDRNRNGQWDTGNYIQKLQPEDVYYYPDIIEIRANWEVNNTWEL